MVSDPLCLDCIGKTYGPKFLKNVQETLEAGALNTCAGCGKTRVVYRLPMEPPPVRKRCPHCKGALDEV